MKKKEKRRLMAAAPTRLDPFDFDEVFSPNAREQRLTAVVVVWGPVGSFRNAVWTSLALQRYDAEDVLLVTKHKYTPAPPFPTVHPSEIRVHIPRDEPVPSCVIFDDDAIDDLPKSIQQPYDWIFPRRTSYPAGELLADYTKLVIVVTNADTDGYDAHYHMFFTIDVYVVFKTSGLSDKDIRQQLNEPAPAGMDMAPSCIRDLLKVYTEEHGAAVAFKEGQATYFRPHIQPAATKYSGKR